MSLHTLPRVIAKKKRTYRSFFGVFPGQSFHQPRTRPRFAGHISATLRGSQSNRFGSSGSVNHSLVRKRAYSYWKQRKGRDCLINSLINSKRTYQMRRIVHVAMSSEFGLDVLVAEEPHLCREVLSVSAQKPSVKGNGRQ